MPFWGVGEDSLAARWFNVFVDYGRGVYLFRPPSYRLGVIGTPIEKKHMHQWKKVCTVCRVEQ